MDIVLLNPAGLAALAAVAVPLVVHLLLRRRATRLAFPSLRFIPPSSAAAVRIRSISDWPLLIVRCGIVAAAGLALARPLLVTPARQAGWDGRIARAVVVDVSASAVAGDGPDQARRAAEEESRTAFRAHVVEAADLERGAMEAARWLMEAPPARRELVVISDFQRGALDDATLSRVSSSIGVRLRQVIPSGTVGRSSPEVEVVVRAPDADRLAVEAALDAAGQPRDIRSKDGVTAVVMLVTRGAEVPQKLGPLRAPWMAAAVAALPEGRTGTIDNRTLVVALDAPADSFELPLAIRAVRRALLAPAAWREVEPDRIAAETLEAWSRPAPPIGEAQVALADEDDGRWLWLAALGLIGLETWLRRRLDRGAGKTEVREAAHAA